MGWVVSSFGAEDDHDNILSELIRFCRVGSVDGWWCRSVTEMVSGKNNGTAHCRSLVLWPRGWKGKRVRGWGIGERGGGVLALDFCCSRLLSAWVILLCWEAVAACSLHEAAPPGVIQSETLSSLLGISTDWLSQAFRMSLKRSFFRAKGTRNQYTIPQTMFAEIAVWTTGWNRRAFHASVALSGVLLLS